MSRFAGFVSDEPRYSHSCADQPDLVCSACLTPAQKVRSSFSKIADLFYRRAVTLAFRMGYRAALDDHKDIIGWSTQAQINNAAMTILGDDYVEV